MREPPPPMMSAPMMMDRKRMLVIGSIVFGLFLLFLGAAIVDSSHLTADLNTPAGADRANVWGPVVAHAGIFFFVVGLVGAAILLEDLDNFVRLFLLIVAFVALFLGAYAASGDSWTTTVWRVAQLLAAVLVLIFVF